MMTATSERPPQGLEAGARLGSKKGGEMRQNMLYLIIGALVVVVIALGIYIYREQTRPKGVELKIDDKGISIQQN